jgi:hypothetical protein
MAERLVLLTDEQRASLWATCEQAGATEPVTGELLAHPYRCNVDYTLVARLLAVEAELAVSRAALDLERAFVRAVGEAAVRAAAPARQRWWQRPAAITMTGPAHAELVAANAVLGRLRAAHRSAVYRDASGHEIEYCLGCDAADGSWPCPVVQALDGGDRA